MKKALLWFFRDFKFARKQIGGTWYCVIHLDSGGGTAGPISYWTQDPPDETKEILITESYGGVVKHIKLPGHTTGHTARKIE